MEKNLSLSLSTLRRNFKNKILQKELWISLSPEYLGRIGEAFVRAGLEEAGFEIIAKNLRTPFSEIDLVAAKQDLLVIAEVKTRFHRIKNKSLFSEISFSQRSRLTRGARFVWSQRRKDFRHVRCVLFVVTDCGIESLNLPLLYDRN